MLADLASAAYLRGEYAEMREWAQRIEPAADDDGAVRAAYATLLAVGDAFAGEIDAAAAGIAEALAHRRGARATRSSAPRPSWSTAVSWGLLALERLVDGLAVARRLAAAARASGNGLASIIHDLAAVLALGLLGRMTEAETAADEVEQAARVSANAQLLQWTLWMRAWVLMEAGRLDAAQTAAAESVELAADARRLGLAHRRAHGPRRRPGRPRRARARPRPAAPPTRWTTAGSAAGRRTSSRATSHSTTWPPPASTRSARPRGRR